MLLDQELVEKSEQVRKEDPRVIRTRQLLQQGRGDSRRGSGDNDCLVRGVFGQAQRAIAHMDTHIQ